MKFRRLYRSTYSEEVQETPKESRRHREIQETPLLGSNEIYGAQGEFMGLREVHMTLIKSRKL